MNNCYHFAFVINRYFHYGGLQRDMIRIARECCQRGHKVDIITGKWEGDKPEIFSIHETPVRALTNHGKNDKLAEKAHRIIAAGLYDCVAGFIKCSGLDIYYSGDVCFAEKIARTKSKVTAILPRYRHYLRQEAEVFKKGLKTEILLIAHQEKDHYIRSYDTEPHRFHLLPPGIDRQRLLSSVPDDSERRDIRRSFGVEIDQRLVLMVGSGFRTKSVDRAISALASLPDNIRETTRLVIVGEGKPAPYIRRAQKYGVDKQVLFVGVRDDVPLLYHSADILLHPAYNENTGTALIEAMVCGAPVLTTANCGFSEYVMKANAGLICPLPFKQEKLNEQLKHMLLSSEQQLWKQNGIDYCKENDVFSLIEKAADILILRAERNRSSI